MPKARAYVEGLLARGQHTFTREDAEAALRSSPVAVYHSLHRLQTQGWLAMPRRGFYLIVDPEHRQLGSLPPTAWIDDLMSFHHVLQPRFVAAYPCASEAWQAGLAAVFPPGTYWLQWFAPVAVAET